MVDYPDPMLPRWVDAGCEEVDGGITAATIGAAAQAGATVFCAGSAVFDGPGTMADHVTALRQVAAAAMTHT